MRQSCSTIEPTEVQQHMFSERESIGPSAEYMSLRLIYWELANRYSFGERLSDASRAVGVKLLGYRAAPAAWHPRFVLPSVAADQGFEPQATRNRRDVE